MRTICDFGYLVGVVELVVHEPGDDAGLAHGLVAEEHQLVLGQRRHHRCHRLPAPRRLASPRRLGDRILLRSSRSGLRRTAGPPATPRSPRCSGESRGGSGTQAAATPTRARQCSSLEGRGGRERKRGRRFDGEPRPIAADCQRFGRTSPAARPMIRRDCYVKVKSGLLEKKRKAKSEVW